MKGWYDAIALKSILVTYESPGFSYLGLQKSNIRCNGRTIPSPKLEAYADQEDPKNVITKLCRQMTNSLCGKQTMGFTLECYRLRGKPVQL